MTPYGWCKSTLIHFRESGLGRLRCVSASDQHGPDPSTPYPIATLPASFHPLPALLHPSPTSVLDLPGLVSIPAVASTSRRPCSKPKGTCNVGYQSRQPAKPVWWAQQWLHCCLREITVTRLLGSRPSWATEETPGHWGLHRMVHGDQR